MNASKLLFALLITTLIGLSSCTTETKNTVDPKVGTWKETSANGVIEFTYTTDKKIILKITPTNGNVSIVNADWNKNLGDNADVYEATALSNGGVNEQIIEPYFKAKMVINGSTADITIYEAYNTVSTATSSTTVVHHATMTKQ